MKGLFTALTAFMVAMSASAESARVNGGLSPDGRFEVRIVAVPNSSDGGTDYKIQIRTAQAKKPFFTLKDVGGHYKYSTAKDYCQAFWNPSSDLVVITDKPGHASQEIYLLAVSGRHVQLLTLPDYVQNALGRVNATEISHDCVSTPTGWKKDDLNLTLYFGVATPDDLRRFYNCDVTLHITHEENQGIYIELKKVTQPQDAG